MFPVLRETALSIMCHGYYQLSFENWLLHNIVIYFCHCSCFYSVLHIKDVEAEVKTLYKALLEFLVQTQEAHPHHPFRKSDQ